MENPIVHSFTPGGILERGDAERLAGILKVLAEPSRLRMVSLMTGANGGVSVSDLVGPVGLSQPTITHHMISLREAGLVETQREGRFGANQLVLERFEEVADVLRQLGNTKHTRKKRR